MRELTDRLTGGKPMLKLWIILMALVVLVGCGNADSGDAIEGEVTFCRRVGSSTGKRIEVGTEFQVREGKKNQYVHGLVDLRNLPEGVDHQIHLVWIKPNSEEMFRRFGTIRMDAHDGGYRSQATWLDAEDLHKKTIDEAVLSDSAGVTVSSRLNVSPERERDPGTYHLRVFWNRALLIEQAFELIESDEG